MKEIEFHPLAENDADTAAEFLKGKRPGHEALFTAELNRNLVYILNTPQGSPFTGTGKRLRRRSFRRFSYGIVYALTDSLIYIVAVAHDSRHPDYWKKRIADIPEE